MASSDGAQLEFSELLFSTGRGLNSEGPSGRSISVLLIPAAAGTEEAVTKILSSMEYLPSCVEVRDREGLEGALATTEFDVILCESSNASTESMQLLAAVHNEGYEIPILAFTRKNISEVIGRQLGRAVNDVSVRRARRLYAQQLQERFLTLIENSSDAIALMTPNALITYTSPSTKRILGYGTNELVGHNCLDLLHPEDRRRAERGVAELTAESGRTMKTEVRVRHKDGSWREMEGVSCNLLRNPNVRAIVLNFRDITERKRAEEALRDSELRYATLAEAVPSMLYTHLPTGSNDYMSPSFYEYTGMLAGTALGHGWNHALHPDDADRCTCLWWQCVREGILFESEYRLRRFDGVYRWFLGRCVPVRDESGKVIRWFGVCTDIDDRKRAEETLRKSESRFRALIEKSSDGFVLVDKDGVIFYAGPPILGYSADESIGRNSLGLIHHEDRPEITRRLKELFQEPAKNVRCQFRAHHKDGSWRWIEAECKNLIDEPSVGGIVVNYRDITERKGFEEQLRQTQRLESLGVLAGGIAHDFNNLLAVILGNATLAASTLPPGAPASGALEDVIRASERATDLTRQMLAFAGKGRFVTRVVDISELVHDIGHLMKAAMHKRAQLRWELDRGLPAIKADAGQIQQVVMNLLINAAEAIPEHGNVLVSTSLQEVDEDYLRQKFPGEHLRPGTYVILQVQDSGIGMDEITQSKIFDPFFSTKFKGRGLGLAATLGIVRGHGGAIRVESAPGQGTTFRILLPSVAERPEQRPNKTAPANLTVSGAILVVDDEEPLRNMAREVLLHYGSTVLLAEDGQVAVDLFRERADQIALVLLDLTMPVLDGEETLRRLRAIKPEVKVILSSGYNETETIRKFAGQDLAGFLQKPYSASELAAAVSAVLKRVPA